MKREGGANPRITIILHSGSYDRATYALSLALIGLAMGREVHLLLTYGGLRRFTKCHLDDLGEETPPVERKAIERGLSTGGIKAIGSYLADAKALGLKLHACASAMATLNIARDDLLPEIDQVTGLANFVQLAEGATANWYI
ncbi:MAG: DsrE/DsrF/DrsH-like family protein [Chloroflexi bacterium]|nr:DsrE/DsrF/DrsH-like family protein [Chloroflexota bacterium]